MAANLEQTAYAAACKNSHGFTSRRLCARVVLLRNFAFWNLRLRFELRQLNCLVEDQSTHDLLTSTCHLKRPSRRFGRKTTAIACAPYLWGCVSHSLSPTSTAQVALSFERCRDTKDTDTMAVTSSGPGFQPHPFVPSFSSWHRADEKTRSCILAYRPINFSLFAILSQKVSPA